MPVFLMNLKRIPDLEPISAEACGKSVWPLHPKVMGKEAVPVSSHLINLLTIYDKSERESINRSEILALLEKNGLR